MARVVALLFDEQSRNRIRQALHERGEVMLCETGSKLLAEAGSRYAPIVLLELRDKRGTTMVPLIRQLRELSRSATIIVYCSLTASDVRLLLDAQRAGANALVLRGHEDFGKSLRAVMSAAINDSIATEVLQELASAVPATVELIVDCCLRHAHEHLTVRTLAEKLGKHRNTLAHRLSAAGMPSLHEVIAWCKLLVASVMMERTDHSVNEIARDLAFSSGSAFRGMLRRYTGLTPQELREVGGHAFLVETFRVHMTSGLAIDLPPNLECDAGHWSADSHRGSADQLEPRTEE